MTKCPSCGEENPAGVGICKKCGGKISMEETRQIPPPDVEPGSFEDEILGLLRGEKKIEAIKRYRIKYSVGLKEAKDAVEALAKTHNIEASGVGCAGVLLFVAAAVTVVANFI